MSTQPRPPSAMNVAPDPAIDIFPWDDNFNTGIASIDEQHRMLVRLLNVLASHVAFDRTEPSLAEVFEELADYAVYHFDSEEKIWAEFLDGDPLEQGHLEAHGSFVREVSHFRESLSTAGHADLAAEALGFLARWLASHILESDRLLAYTVGAMRQGYALDEAKAEARQRMSGATRSLIDIILSIYSTLSSNTLRLMRELAVRRKQDQDLVLQRDFSETILSAQVDGVAVFRFIEADPFVCFTVWNPAMERLTGYTIEEANQLGWRRTFYVQPEVQERARLRLDRASQGEHLDGEEWDIGRKDGVIRTCSIHTRFVTPPGSDQVQVMVVMRDVTERKRADDKLRLAARVFEHANEGITVTDADGTILDVNAAFSRITGYSRGEAIGQNPRILKSGRHDKAFYANLWKHIKELGSWKGEVWNRRKDGEIYAELLTIGTIQDENGLAQGYVALFSDISDQKAHQRQLEHIAHHDALTGLPNRVLLADRLKQAMAQSQRRGGQLAVLYLDLDGFKAVNDLYGHDVGDELLVRVAEWVRRTLREGDTLARLGGDEFVGVLVDLPDASSCLPLLDRILEAVATPRTDGAGRMLQVSASIGVSFYPQAESIDADQLLRQADQAMYQAKLAGKNRYHVFDSARDRALRGRHETLERIQLALDRREFVLHYQPKVNMRDGRVVGVEALLRWAHPMRGLILPGEFLPALESHMLMVHLGDWVIDTALAQVAAWRAQGVSLPVSVNVDASQLAQLDFTSKLAAALARQPGLRAGDLELEVLETSTLHDINRVSELLRGVVALGVGVSLDDFGTGYSSLTYLKRLPAALLKIDQSFVRDMLDDPDDLAILDGVIRLAGSFRRQVIAEGVETVAHGRMLLQLGCELGQGYAIARPMPADDVPQWLADWCPSPLWAGAMSIPHETLPVLFAMAEHRAWLWEVHCYLSDERPAPPPQTARQCHFGKWLATATGFQVSYSDFERLMRLHEQVHSKAEELVSIKRAGAAVDAINRFGEVEVLCDALLQEMDALIA